ncbi:uncharacterized protein V1518DRAFT_413633 [Limtongia smithiae]|uniref:uncharacterized protein n=1 Tax=Limtongia smithiae TaxID=1125753 RepID=UPI0034CFE2D4
MSASSGYRFNSSLHQRDARTQLFGEFESSRPTSPINGYRAATPNTRGQYSDSVMSGLESQNDNEIDGLTAKVKILKDITMRIGDEVRDSSKFMSNLESGFDNTRVQLKGTYNRMMRMAERSGVGWRAWVGFFAFVFLMFLWVWKF